MRECIRKLKLVAAIVMALPVVLFDSAQALARPEPSAVEWQYINALRTNDLAKARSLAKLAHINPAKVAGFPVISWIQRDPGVGLSFIDDATYAYLFDELKQDFNAPAALQPDVSVFATLCNNMGAGPTPYDITNFGTGEWRIGKAIERRGAKA